MKAFSLTCLALGLALPASATVSIEFQLGGVEVPSGSIGVLVAEASVTDDNVFTVPTEAVGATLSVGSKIGSDDVVVAVFSNSDLPDWGTQKGFAEHFAVLDYTALGVEEGDHLVLHVFPDRASGDTIRIGEPHLSYRTGEIGELTSNSTMGFSLPRDGGAYLLAVLDSGNGGNADLATLDLTALPYSSGSGDFNRSLSPTARQTYFFDLAAPGFLGLEGTGAAGLRAELYGPNGQLIASSDGSGGFSFHEELLAGFHTLVIFRVAGGSGGLAYGLNFAGSDLRTVIPDVAVGLSLSGLVGNNVLGGAPGQVASLISAKANPVGGFATIANRGDLPDTLAVRASAGSALCGLTYTDDSGNVTAGLVTGAYRTAELTETDDAVSIRVQFTPNKQKHLKKKKKGRKPVILKRTHSSLIRADSTQGSAAMDAARISALTR